MASIKRKNNQVVLRGKWKKLFCSILYILLRLLKLSHYLASKYKAVSLSSWAASVLCLEAIIIMIIMIITAFLPRALDWVLSRTKQDITMTDKSNLCESAWPRGLSRNSGSSARSNSTTFNWRLRGIPRSSAENRDRTVRFWKLFTSRKKIDIVLKLKNNQTGANLN